MGLGEICPFFGGNTTGKLVSETHTNAHLEVQIAQPVIQIRGDERFDFPKLIHLRAGLPSEQWSFVPGSVKSGGERLERVEIYFG